MQINTKRKLFSLSIKNYIVLSILKKWVVHHQYQLEIGYLYDNQNVYDSDQAVIEMILKKPENSLTEDEKSKISEYLAKYEPVLTRLDKLMTDIKKRLNGEDSVPEYVATPADIAIGRLKSTMKTLKKEVTRVIYEVYSIKNSQKKKRIIIKGQPLRIREVK